jgi:hypothetical protein
MCSLACHPATVSYFNYLRFYHILLSYASFFSTSMVNKSLIPNAGLPMQIRIPPDSARSLEACLRMH